MAYLVRPGTLGTRFQHKASRAKYMHFAWIVVSGHRRPTISINSQSRRRTKSRGMRWRIAHLEKCNTIARRAYDWMMSLPCTTYATCARRNNQLASCRLFRLRRGSRKTLGVPTFGEIRMAKGLIPMQTRRCDEIMKTTRNQASPYRPTRCFKGRGGIKTVLQTSTVRI